MFNNEEPLNVLRDLERTLNEQPLKEELERKLYRAVFEALQAINVRLTALEKKVLDPPLIAPSGPLNITATLDTKQIKDQNPV